MPPDVAACLLSKLATDDAFRELFKSNPRQALSEVGYALPVQALVPTCVMVNELASKEEIQGAYEKLHADLTGASRATMEVVFTFEHGRTAAVANSD